MASKKRALRDNWYYQNVDISIDLASAGINQWSVEGVGIYVGKAKVLKKRILDYPRNVRTMIEGKSWHGDPTRDYRDIHYALRQAHDAELPVSVMILETCDASVRSLREQWWIDLRRREEAEQGGPRVLNANKQKLRVSLDPDVIEKFRATVKGWQSRINAELRKVLGI